MVPQRRHRRAPGRHEAERHQGAGGPLVPVARRGGRPRRATHPRGAPPRRRHARETRVLQAACTAFVRQSSRSGGNTTSSGVEGNGHRAIAAESRNSEMQRLPLRKEQSMTAESAGSPYVKVPCRSRTPRETPYGDRKMPIEFDLSFTGPETA